MKVGQASEVQASLPQVSKSVFETERTLVLRVISLPEGTVLAKSKEAHAKLLKIKGMGVNLVMLPLQTLHTLHQGVSNEICTREKHALSMINKVKLNNE